MHCERGDVADPLSKMKQVSGRLKGALWKKAGEKVVRDNRVARVKKGFLTAVVGEYDDSLLALAMGEGTAATTSRSTSSAATRSAARTSSATTTGGCGCGRARRGG